MNDEKEQKEEKEVKENSSAPSFTSCTILWSTQSGRAKACARRTARLLRSRGVLCTLDQDPHHEQKDDVAKKEKSARRSYGCAFDDYGPSKFLNIGQIVHNNNNRGGSSKKLLVLFVSTTGDAEQCDSIRETWNALLQKSLPTNLFQNITFALFALGDRAYGPTAFCAAGRKLATRLIQLGATSYCDVGYGDDGTPNGGIFADLDIWLEEVLLPAVGGADDGTNDAVGIEESFYRVEVKGNQASSTSNNGNESKSKDRTDINEWLTEKYQTCYDNFFASSCPATAYSYDNISGSRIEDTSISYSGRAPLLGQVTSNTRMTDPNWEQDTRYLRISIDTNANIHSSGSKNTTAATVSAIPYLAGDVATIMPSNSHESVSRFLSVLPTAIQSIADKPIHITFPSPTSANNCTPWPEKCTLRGLLTHCADINSLPEREDLRILSSYCNVNHPMGCDHQQKLKSLSETSDAALYGDYILREKRSWIDVLFDFDSIRYNDGGNSSCLLTVEQLLMILPPIMPRHFSIASAPSTALLQGSSSGNLFEIELCVAKVQGNTPLGRSYEGLCSGYLSRLIPQNLDADGGEGVKLEHHYPPVRLWIKPGSFGKLPLDSVSSPSPPLSSTEKYFETPIMCIGAGTGIAPLRSLLMEREARRALAVGGSGNDGPSNGDEEETTDNANATSPSSLKKMDNILVFGCRQKLSDYYFENDWENLVHNNRLRLLTAFSRDQWHKVYVQRVAREADNGSLIARHLLEDDGAIYIAGGAKMARCVKDEIIECLGEVLPRGERDAKVLLKRLGKIGKFNVEAWS